MDLLDKEFLPDIENMINKFQDKFELIDFHINDYKNEGFSLRIKIKIKLRTTECLFEHGTASIIIVDDKTMVVDRGYLNDIKYLLNTIN
jgi:archaellum component FlaC